MNDGRKERQEEFLEMRFHFLIGSIVHLFFVDWEVSVDRFVFEDLENDYLMSYWL